MADPIPQIYADCIHLPCQNCHAAPGDFCFNPVTRLPRRTPCWIRDHDSTTEARGGTPE